MLALNFTASLQMFVFKIASSAKQMHFLLSMLDTWKYSSCRPICGL